MKTKTKIQLMLTDEEARGNITTSDISTNNFTGNNITMFSNKPLNVRATLEHNYWVLDGQYEIPSSINDFGEISDTLSNSSGYLPYHNTFNYSSNTSILIGFNNNNKPNTNKITITYGTYYNYYNTSKIIDNTCNGCKPTEITIWYVTNNLDYYSQNVYDTSTDKNYTEITLNRSLDDIQAIEIVFHRLQSKNRRLIIDKIYFGEIKEFEDEIISANLLQEASYLNDTLPIGTLDFEINTNEDIFNPLSNNSILDKLKVNSLVALQVMKDNEWYDYGNYFLKTWENSNNNTTKFNCEDGVGILENIEGMFMTTYNILPTSMQTDYDVMRISKYIANQAKNINITLTFPDFEGIYFGKYRCILDSGNYREMLQKMYFGFVNYIIVCTGHNIKTVILNDELENNEDVYTPDDIIVDTDNLKQIKFVKTITVNNHILTLTSEGGSRPAYSSYETLLNETLNAGNYVYDFDTPYYFRITGATIYTPTNNPNTEKRLHIQVDADNTNVKIEGSKYNEEIIISKKENSGSVKDNSKIVIDNYNVEYTTINYLKVYTDLSNNLVNAIADYYSGNRYEYTFNTRKLRSPEDALERYVEIKTSNDKKICGNIIKVQTDLFNGVEHTITINGTLEDDE